MTKKEALQLIKRMQEKADWIDLAMDELQELIKEKEFEFARTFIDVFVDKLETQDNQVLSSPKNKQLLADLDRIYASLKISITSKITIQMVKDMNYILSENTAYYGSLKSSLSNKMFKVTAEQIKGIVYSRLGMKPDGTLIKEGYMDGLLEMPEVRTKIKDFAYRGVLTQSGFEGFKNGFKELIQGEPEKLGAFSKYHRNMAYDTYSQVDAMQGKIYSEELQLKYFIYNGGIIKNSRAFCIKRAGKVFTTKETESWENDPENTAKPPNYDPLINRGGYGCRHSIDYITEAMAKVLRPDLKETIEKETKKQNYSFNNKY